MFVIIGTKFEKNVLWITQYSLLYLFTDWLNLMLEEFTMNNCDGSWVNFNSSFTYGVGYGKKGQKRQKKKVMKIELTNQINYYDGIISVIFCWCWGRVISRLIEQKGRHIRREHSGINDQKQYNPIPKGFEWRIMQNCPFMDPIKIRNVLGKM